VLYLELEQGSTKISWEKLNDILSNVGSEHFDKDSFVQAYNNDTRVKDLVNNFDQDGVVLAGAETPREPDDDKTVDQMADRATKAALK